MNESYIIPAHLQESFDIKALSKKMTEADWYHEYSDDAAVYMKGKVEINEITDVLLQIASQAEGRQLAGWLWDNFVPEHSVGKPEWLVEIYFPDQTQDATPPPGPDHQTVVSLTNFLKETGRNNEAPGDAVCEDLLPKKSKPIIKGFSL